MLGMQIAMTGMLLMFAGAVCFVVSDSHPDESPRWLKGGAYWLGGAGSAAFFFGMLLAVWIT